MSGSVLRVPLLLLFPSLLLYIVRGETVLLVLPLPTPPSPTLPPDPTRVEPVHTEVRPLFLRSPRGPSILEPQFPSTSKFGKLYRDERSGTRTVRDSGTSSPRPTFLEILPLLPKVIRCRASVRFSVLRKVDHPKSDIDRNLDSIRTKKNVLTKSRKEIGTRSHLLPSFSGDVCLLCVSRRGTDE